MIGEMEADSAAALTTITQTITTTGAVTLLGPAIEAATEGSIEGVEGASMETTEVIVKEFNAKRYRLIVSF